jgi:hypothetical protein
MLLQLLAIPVVLWALLDRGKAVPPGPARQLVLLAGLAVAWVAIQLTPLPPAFWSLLPGRGRIADGYALLGIDPPWLSLSLAPYRTIASALWLLPAVAVLLAAVKLDDLNSRWIAWAAPVAALLSLPLGLLQVLLGAAYPYRISDFGLFTGFFANASHLATLLLAAAPLLLGLYLGAGSKPGARRDKRLALAALLAVVLGLALSASTGILLALPVLLACVAMMLRRKRRISRWWLAPILAFSLLHVGLVSFTSFQNERIWNESIGGPDSRHPAIGTSLGAAVDYLPMGSGLGTFQDIYHLYEDVNDVGRVYVNHVHNDYVELLLETGLPGLALMLLFLLWWGRRVQAVWLSSDSGALARAATIASGVILVQSAVGYPLRTAALAALFAACCALMARPRPRKKAATPARRKARHLSAD